MIYGSVCSGIEAASVAWAPLGWRAAFLSEIEAFPRAVLAHHYPAVPLHGDFTTIQAEQYDAIDILVGGTPCQSFSIAGLRGGLADDRGNLALEYLLLAKRLRPRWLVWENVPGVLSSNGGRDFGSILGGLGELGYGFAYRVLDAQYVRVDGFGRAVPQRRRRVFVVGYLGDWRRAASVLFERDSMSGHPAPRREAGKGTAPTLSARTKGGGGLGTDFDLDGGLVARAGRTQSVAHCFDARQSDVVQYGDMTGPLDTDGHSMAVAFHENQRGELTINDTAGSLKTSGGKPGQGYPAVAFDMRGREGGSQFEGPHDTANIRAASGGSSRSYVAQPWRVRRLTPRECERLQGFPENYTAVTYRKKPAADGPRYKALGNSMAVNCMRWIGRRIEMVERIFAQAA